MKTNNKTKPSATTVTVAADNADESTTSKAHHIVEGPGGQPLKVTTQTITKPGKRPKVTVLLETDDLVREQAAGFVNFLREHAIVGLAVGFIVGQQAQGVVKQLIASFIDPAFQLFFGKTLSGRTFTLHLFNNHADFGWGGMVYVLLNLFFVLAVIYALIKIFKLDKLDKPKPKK